MKQVCVSNDVDAEQKQVDNGMIFGSFDPKLSDLILNRLKKA